jgi:hypothetical protein
MAVEPAGAEGGDPGWESEEDPPEEAHHGGEAHLHLPRKAGHLWMTRGFRHQLSVVVSTTKIMMFVGAPPGHSCSASTVGPRTLAAPRGPAGRGKVLQDIVNVDTSTLTNPSTDLGIKGLGQDRSRLRAPPRGCIVK